jgi:CBS domain-containing protein
MPRDRRMVTGAGKGLVKELIMAQDNTVARSLHDLGLAAWFGGSLMGAVGLNGAAAAVDQPQQRLRVANAGWARWTPVNLAGIAAHVAGGSVLLVANKGRVAGQRGVATATIAKTALTGLALAATGYSRVLGAKLQRVGDTPVEGGTTPAEDSPEEVAKAQRQLNVLQWVIPGLTGATLVLNAKMGEQQRPTNVTTGMLQGARRRLPWAVPALAAGVAVLARRRRTGKHLAGEGAPAQATPPTAAEGLPTDTAEREARRRWRRRQPAGGMPQVRQVMTADVVTVSPSMSVAEVAQEMIAREKGPLPVVEGGRVVAMVTDRDLVARVVAASRDPNTVRCEEIATKDLVTIGPDQDLQEARRLLAQHQLDRLLVVEEGDRLVGILSEADIRKDEGPLASPGRRARRRR